MESNWAGFSWIPKSRAIHSWWFKKKNFFQRIFLTNQKIFQVISTTENSWIFFVFIFTGIFISNCMNFFFNFSKATEKNCFNWIFNLIMHSFFFSNTFWLLRIIYRTSTLMDWKNEEKVKLLKLFQAHFAHLFRVQQIFLL